MNNPFIFSEALVQALGWTLVHSLWQGAAIALILWLLLPRLQRPGQRYWASYGALLSVFFTAIVTFAWVYTGRPATPEGTEGSIFSGYVPEATVPFIAPAGPGLWPGIAAALEPYNPLIVSIWLLGFCFFLFQFVTGLHLIYRLRRQQNRPLGPEWQDKLQALAARLGQTRPVALLESALVKAPVALGFFKPLILLPFGMANQLTLDEVEAILAHELAHIVRRDWLFNLIQAFIEALFYFHPAVWWIAATVRAERENCCDDTAVALTGNRLTYAKTLVRLQDIARSAPALALGIAGTSRLLRRRPLLLERIKRILQQPQQSASLMEKTIALAILVALITFLTLRANTPLALTEGIREIAEKPISWLAQAPQAAFAWQAAATDTVPQPKKRQRILREDDDQKVELELENGKITQLRIDGQEIKPEDYEQYRSLTDALREEAAAPPPPPAPPAPPAAPHGIWQAPAPPAPFPARSSSRISTETDDAGNTIIRVERNGEPLEIRVKDGEVWVENEKIEEGDVMDIDIETEAPFPHLFWNDKDMQIRIDGNRLHFRRPQGGIIEAPEAPHFFHFEHDGNRLLFKGEDGAILEMPDMRIAEFELQRKLEEARDLTEEQRRILKKELQESRKELQKSLKERDRALQDAERALEKARQEQRADNNSARREYERAIARPEHRAGSLSSTMQNALLRDKLIDDPDNYSFDLSKKDMRVNGKKQPDAIHEKYLALYRKYAGKDIGDARVRIRMKN